MSENLNSFPEVAGIFPLRFSNAALWAEYRRNLWDWGFQGAVECEGQPLSAGPGMALQILRMALVRETVEASAQDSLRLLDGAPASWFEAGKKIAVKNAPTFFGRISFSTDAFANFVQVRVEEPADFRAREMILRVPDPAGRALRRVLIDGQPWSEFQGNEIRLPKRTRMEIRAEFE